MCALLRKLENTIFQQKFLSKRLRIDIAANRLSYLFYSLRYGVTLHPNKPIKLPPLPQMRLIGLEPTVYRLGICRFIQISYSLKLTVPAFATVSRRILMPFCFRTYKCGTLRCLVACATTTLFHEHFALTRGK